MLLSIPCHLSICIPPENNRKQEVFSCFQGVQKETSDMKTVERGFDG